MTQAELARLLAGVVVLLALTALVLKAGRVAIGWSPAVAVARGAAQLAVVGMLLGAVLRAPAAVALALVVMLVTASATAARRLSAFEHPAIAVILACLAGAGLTLITVFAFAVLPLSARYVVALGGIVIGGTMTATTLAGRHLQAGLEGRRDEVEAWLSLGATMRQAVAAIARGAAAEALVPALDQTRTTGLVTLPGAFIGALLAGASPVRAARFQLVVLAAIICGQAIAVVLLVHMLSGRQRLPLIPAS